MVLTDFDAATLCRALYAYEGDPAIIWDHLDTGEDDGVYYAIKRNADGINDAVFRGTSNIQDALRDLDALPYQTSGQYAALGTVHAGFYKGLEKAVDELLAFDPAGKFRLIGHSYGAAHANLAAQMLTCRSFTVPPPILFGEPNASFGQPLFARSYQNGSDPVCALPMFPYVRRRDVILIDEPAPADDIWGPWLGRHRIQRYQDGAAKICANLKTDAPMTVFDTAFNNLLGWEGGYGNNIHDPGGATNLGVIQTEYDTYRKKKGLPEQSVAAITRAEAEEIYQTEYWGPTHCDELDPGVANCLFDGDVNSGDRRGVLWLQGAINAIAGRTIVQEDGVSGAETVTAANAAPPDHLIDEMLSLRLAFMQRAHNPQTGEALWPVFGHGWNARVAGVREQSLKLIQTKPFPVIEAHSINSVKLENTMTTSANTATSQVNVTVPAGSSNVTINPWINTALNVLSVVGGVITTNNINVGNIIETLSGGSFWGGMLATVVPLIITHYTTIGSNTATLSALNAANPQTPASAQS